MILKKRTPGAGLPPSGGGGGGGGGQYTCMYYHDSQRSFSLKPFGQSKPNVLLSILRKGE